MSNVTRLKNWQQRVHRVASRLPTKGEAMRFIRSNNTVVDPVQLRRFNPAFV